MSITAARLGQAPITLDWSGIGNAQAMSVPDKAAWQAAWTKLKARFDAKEVGFYQAPSDEALSEATKCQALAKQVLDSPHGFTDCLLLGIGGSALGPLSALTALKERAKSPIRFHVMQNTDPMEWKATIASLDPARTYVACITKSGTTFETLSQFLLALHWLGETRWKTHIVAITDPTQGDLGIWARKHEVPMLHIAPSIGGRFSIFSPVGLFPMALAGLSVPEFLQGAIQIRDHVEKVAVEKNPLFTLGAELIRHFAKRPIHVCMPYSTRLQLIGDWFVQLWAESLGKDGKGFTPIGALGATDQHSILQLLRDGPDDKVTGFITVDNLGDEVVIPKPLLGSESARLPAFRILENHSLGELMRIEYRATSLVLTRRSRPHFTLQLDRLDERSLGALYFGFSVLTGFTGTLWGVNPFDQPGVEEAKIYIRESLSQESRTRAAEDDTNSPVARLRREPSDGAREF